jgi:D-alanyl-D-alanine carboxypeptidase (penicillin-binding protein 5/6)
MSKKPCLVLSVIFTTTMLLAACLPSQRSSGGAPAATPTAAPTASPTEAPATPPTTMPAAPVQPTTAPTATAAKPLAERVPLQLTLVENVQFAWPAAGQAAVAEVKDGRIARSFDNEKPRPIASMAKVITALAIMEKQPFELGQEGQIYTITAEDIANMNAYIAESGSELPLLIGMELTQYQAMQRMLIASDNNMADLLVERIFGSKEAYVSYAQDMLQRMGLSQTVVADASGFSPDTASTSSELIAIGIAALQNPVIAEIVAQPQAQLPVIGTIQNTNELLGADGVIGIKTGTTDEAGHCLLFAARYAAGDGQEVTIVGVIMGDTNATSLFSDSRNLLASAKQGFGLVEAQPTGNVVAP